MSKLKDFYSTGGVSWTTSTSNTDIASSEGVLADTTSNAITVTLPLTPIAGDLCAVSDYAGTFEVNNLTINRNGSNINGVADDLILDENNQSVTMVYTDVTQGWVLVSASAPFPVTPTIHVGTTVPVDTLGIDGDIYYKVD